jgi:lambda family phage tail tape measure protein
LTKINELTKEQIDLQNQLEIAIKQSGDIQSRWTLSWQQQLIQLENQWKDLATSLAHGAFQTIVQGVQAMADALTNVIMGTQRAGAAFAQFATTALTSFIEMVLETIIYAKLAIPILTALGVLSSGATAAGGSAVTIASLGAAMSFVGGIVGFAGGGLVTGPGTGSSDSIPARLSNGEYVFSAPAVQRIGVSNLEMLHHGGSLQNSTIQNIKATAHVIVVNDRNEMLNALQSSAAEEIVVAHVRKNRLKIGIQT